MKNSYARLWTLILCADVVMIALMVVLVVMVGGINDSIADYHCPECERRALEESAIVENTVAVIPVEVEPSEPVETVEYFDVPLDTELQDFIFAECAVRGVDPEIVISMIERESKFNASAVGDGGNSLGLMQIQPRWHKARMDRLSCDDLLDPYQNVTVGIDYIAELMEKEKSIEWVLMAYNGGPNYANKLVAKGKVSDYAKTVLCYSDRLERGIVS